MLTKSINPSPTKTFDNYFYDIDELDSSNSLSLFDAKEDEILDAMVIKINLPRAVSEHASFFREFVTVLLTHEIQQYIVDFSDTEFLDSSFLGSLIYFFKRVKHKHCNLSLVIDISKITILAEIIDLNGIKIFTSIKEAKQFHTLYDW